MDLAILAVVDETEIGEATDGRCPEAFFVAIGDIGGNLGEADAPDTGRGPGEAPIDKCLCDAHCLEDLRATVAGDRGDAHLGHDPEQALVCGLPVVSLKFGSREFLVAAFALEGPCGCQCEVGVDCASAVANQAGEMVDVPGFAGLDDDVGAHPLVLADEMVMDGCCRKECRDWCVPRCGPPVT